MSVKREVVFKGHIVDSGTMSKALDEIIVHHGRFKILDFKIGQTNSDLSTTRISYTANSDTELVRELYGGLTPKPTFDEVQVPRAINSKAGGRGRVNELLIYHHP